MRYIARIVIQEAELFTEINLGDLVVSPYTFSFACALLAWVLTRVLIPVHWWDAVSLKRSVVHLSLLTCYLALAVGTLRWIR